MPVPLFVLLRYLSTSSSTETVGGATSCVQLRPRISAGFTGSRAQPAQGTAGAWPAGETCRADGISI